MLEVLRCIAAPGYTWYRNELAMLWLYGREDGFGPWIPVTDEALSDSFDDGVWLVKRAILLLESERVSSDAV